MAKLKIIHKSAALRFRQASKFMNTAIHRALCDLEISELTASMSGHWRKVNCPDCLVLKPEHAAVVCQKEE